MKNTLHDALFAAHMGSDQTFLHDTDGTSLSYGGFFERAAKFVHVLRNCGLKPDDRVMVQADKSIDMLALYVATIQAGAVFLPLNPAYTVAEVSYFIEDASPALLVCDPERSAALSAIAKNAGAQVLTLSDSGTGTLCDAAAAMPTTAEITPRGGDDLAALLYTSGTTGRSKGAMLSHENLLSNALTLTDHWRMTSDDVLLHALPIFHTHGLFVAVNTCLAAGAAMNFHRGFDLDQIITSLGKSSVMMGVPTFYTRLLGDARMDRDLCRNMRLFISGSAPLLAETHVLFEARTGQKILERYGMTETNMITSNPYVGDRRAGTVGPPLDGIEVRITAPGTDDVVAKGELGVIEVRGPNVFQGYWNMPKKTREELRDEGFFITGDLGQFDADGYLQIVGRQKDMIITGGYNVYPKEIEDVLNAVPGVAESAVFGVADADFGERVIAAIVCSGSDPADAETLKQAVAQNLARFKKPRTYVFLDQLPRNAMGKVQKNLLRDAHS